MFRFRSIVRRYWTPCEIKNIKSNDELSRLDSKKQYLCLNVSNVNSFTLSKDKTISTKELVVKNCSAEFIKQIVRPEYFPDTKNLTIIGSNLDFKYNSLWGSRIRVIRKNF